MQQLPSSTSCTSSTAVLNLPFSHFLCRTWLAPWRFAQVAGGSTNNGVTRAKVATILFAAKASTYNWFDPDILTRHAIQWLPFSPTGSNALLPTAWLQESAAHYGGKPASLRRNSTVQIPTSAAGHDRASDALRDSAAVHASSDAV
jgi:uncharacterized protein YceK